MDIALTDAYATCLRLARSHYENFPVASWLMPAALRPHIAAIYAFARTADDFADEPGLSDDVRLRHLEDWRKRLVHPPTPAQVSGELRCDGAPKPRGDGGQPPDDAIFLALRDTIDRFDLPIQLFDDLLSAFTQDVTTSRYAAWSDVLDYCRRSANPVGRLVLRVFGYRHDDLDAASDALCTALQLTNFWQDLAIDWSRGRVYLSKDVWSRHGADLSGLASPPLSHAWKASLRDVTDRTRGLFEQGRSVCDGVSGRLRYELRATWLGGARILDRLEAADFDVVHRRPKLGMSDAMVIALRTAAWKAESRLLRADNR